MLLNMLSGKNCYTDVNKPTWWPDGLRFCSPNSGKNFYWFLFEPNNQNNVGYKHVCPQTLNPCLMHLHGSAWKLNYKL